MVSVTRGRYSPKNPSAMGTTFPAPGDSGVTIRSAIVGDNSDLFQQVSQLWICPDDVSVDVTYGRGVFWKQVSGPTHAFDLASGTDLGSVPLPDSSADVYVIDPPYRPTHGSKNFNGSNGLSDAYQLGKSSLDTIEDVLDLYRRGLAEAFRVLKPMGRVLVKSQDLSYRNRLHLVTWDVLWLMIATGFELADQFILVKGSQLSSPVWKRQERARRNHSVLWVGVKP